MKRALTCATALLLGCSCGRKLPEPAVFCLLVPASPVSQSETPEPYWRREIRMGFGAAVKQFDLETATVEYAEPTAQSVLQAARALPGPKGAPICIVFTRREPIKKALDALLAEGRTVVTIGESDASSARVAHSGGAAELFARQWTARVGQMEPRPQRVLVLFGDTPADKNRIAGSLHARSGNWKLFELRVRRLPDVAAEDFAWADLVTPVGEDAVKACLKPDDEAVDSLSLREKAVNSPTREKAVNSPTRKKAVNSLSPWVRERASTPRMLPVDASDVTLGLIRSGKVNSAFAPDYFQMAYRAVRLAREYYLQGQVATPIVAMPYKEVDATTLTWFIKKRHVIPPVVFRSKETRG